MPSARELSVHLLPGLIEPGRLAGGVAVAVDVLRATTTIVHALAAGCPAVWPCAEVEEAKVRAAGIGRRALLAGERGGVAISGFDLGNSPGDFKSSACKGRDLVLTTTNGTKALLRAAEAERVMVGAFVNFS